MNSLDRDYWRAPYPWTLADKNGIIPAPAGWTGVLAQFVFKDRAGAASMARWSTEYQMPARAVPLPYTGEG